MGTRQPSGTDKDARQPDRAGREAEQRRREQRKHRWGRSLVLLWLAALLAMAGMLSLGSGQAWARAARPANTISITKETQTYSYPSQMVFQLQASDSSGNITGAQLEISVRQEGVDHQIPVQVTQPGSFISLTYTYNSSNDYLPPFTPVTYHWTLSDSAQASYTGPDQQFDFVDTRFTWQHLTQNSISVYWYGQDTSYGQNILNTAVSDATSIEHDLNGTITTPLRVVVYASDQDFRGGLPPGTPNWAGGVALIGLYECMVVIGDPSTHALERDLPHELTHLIFHEIAGLGCGGCPLWFDEGMAVYHQLYHEPDMQDRFNQAVSTKSLLLFSTLTRQFPQDSSLAELAYAQSWNFIEYLYKQYTQPKVARLVDSLSSKNFNSAFVQVFGEDTNHMESQWHVSLGLPPTLDNTSSTPSSGSTGGQSPDGITSTANGSLVLLAALIFGLLLVGLIGGGVLWRRGRHAPAPAPGFGPQAPLAGGMPQGFQPVYQNGMPPGMAGAPPATGQGWYAPGPAAAPYEQLVGQRQQLWQAVNDLMAQEKRLASQHAYLESQMAYVAEEAQRAQADQRADLTRQAAQQRHQLEGQLFQTRQQIENLSQHKSQMLQAGRQLSAQIEALSQQPVVRRHAPQE